MTLTQSALGTGLATIKEALAAREIAASDHGSFAKAIQDAHNSSPMDGDHGRITLFVCNTVERALRT